MQPCPAQVGAPTAARHEQPPKTRAHRQAIPPSDSSRMRPAGPQAAPWPPCRGSRTWGCRAGAARRPPGCTRPRRPLCARCCPARTARCPARSAAGTSTARRASAGCWPAPPGTAAPARHSPRAQRGGVLLRCRRRSAAGSSQARVASVPRLAVQLLAQCLLQQRLQQQQQRQQQQQQRRQQEQDSARALNWNSCANWACTSCVCARPRQWRGRWCVCAATSSSASSGSKAAPCSVTNARLMASTMPSAAAHLRAGTRAGSARLPAGCWIRAFGAQNRLCSQRRG